MSTNHNRIKVADLEKNQPNKVLLTNSNGELEFSEINYVTSDAYNALDYTLAGKSLDARQGKVLKNLIDDINALLVSDNIDLNTLQNLVDAIEVVQNSLNTLLVNNLTSGGATKALTAEMGKTLQNNKVDKVAGKSLLADTEITRLGTLSNYTHPANHSPGIITQDPGNRFVTDTEKATWNAKEGNITAGTSTQYFRGDKTWQTLGKTAVGLANVDNTADVAKNVLSATKLTTPRTINGTAFDGSANITINAVDATARIASDEKGAANGVATLDASGIIPTAQLPSYVDDVLEFVNLAGFPATGDTGKIYVAKDTNKTYRWGGTAYVYITSGAVDSVSGRTGVITLNKADVGLSAVDNTADAGKNVLSATKLITPRTINNVPFDGSANITITDTTKENNITAGTTVQYFRGDKTWQTLDKTAAGLANVDNTSDLNKPVSTATQTALNLKASLTSPTFTGVPTAPTAASGTNTTQIATTAFVLANSNITPDATTALKGKIKLTGDLGGTADLPTTPTALHITGNESWTGIKSSINNGSTQINGISLTNGGTGDSASLVSRVTQTGFGLLIYNQGGGVGTPIGTGAGPAGIGISQSNTGSGMLIHNSANGVGLQIYNTSSGRGFSITTSSNGPGIFASNTTGSTGISIYSTVLGSGNGIVSNVDGGGTGLAFVGQSVGANTFTVNKFGDIVANSYTGKATLTSIPTAPTAAPGTNTTQIATTAFVLANSASIPHLKSNNTDLTVWNNGKSGAMSNTSFGERALRSTTATSNTFNSGFGVDALASLTTGIINTAIGYNTLSAVVTGLENTGIGGNALRSVTGSLNTGIGSNAGGLTTSGFGNVMIGAQSLSNNTTGSQNVMIGINSGAYATGGATFPNTVCNDSIFIGAGTIPLSSGQTNQIIIGTNAVGKGSNTTVIGNVQTTDTYIAGRINGVKRYKLINMNQSGTGIPTFTVLENSIGSIVWTRSSSGTYTGTLSGAFISGKVHCTYTNGAANAVIALNSTTNNTITLYSSTLAGILTDGYIAFGSLTIEVYP